MRSGVLLWSLIGTMALGCSRTYWVADGDLREAQKVSTSIPKDAIALPADENPNRRAPPIYLRYSMLIASEPSSPGSKSLLRVQSPNKRNKRIAGFVLLGFGVPLVAAGIGLVAYGASLTGRDSLGAGIIAGLGGIPLGVGVPLLISGAVLVGRNGGPADRIPPGDPAITYIGAPAGLSLPVGSAQKE